MFFVGEQTLIFHDLDFVDTDVDTSNEKHGNGDNRNIINTINTMTTIDTMMTMRITLLILMASSLLVRSQVSKSREAVEESICIVHWKQYWCEIHNS